MKLWIALNVSTASVMYLQTRTSNNNNIFPNLTIHFLLALVRVSALISYVCAPDKISSSFQYPNPSAQLPQSWRKGG